MLTETRRGENSVEARPRLIPGLSLHVSLQKIAYIHARRRTSARRLHCEELESRQLLSGVPMAQAIVLHPGVTANSTTPSGLTPTQIRNYYGVNSLSFGSTMADGTGQTIAIVDAYDDPNIQSDLAVFDSTFGIKVPPSFKVVNQNGGSTLPSTDPTGGWEVETTLDVEWAHAIAPGASILLVEANDANDNNGLGPASANLYAAVDYARHQPGVSVVSMSFGTQDSLANQAMDQYLSSYILVTPAGHQPITFVASSGDDGWAVFPSTSPNVVSVGGTFMSVNSSGTILNESAWGLPNSVNGSGGGGISQEFKGRQVPDVSYNAAPESGYALYSTFGPDGTGWLDGGVGGTSAGSPQWAALIAIANQGRALNGLPSLNGATQTLPALYSAPSNAFTDIIDGTNENEFSYSWQTAAPGYDLATGIGTPAANNLIPYLASYTNSGTTSGSGGGGSPVVNPSVSPTNVSAPGSFAGSPLSSTQIGLTWTAASGAAGYRLYQSINGTATLIATIGGSATSYTVSNLTAGVTYAFNLVAFNGSATAASAWISVTTTPLVTAPTNFTGVALSNTQISLSWSAASGATSYRLYQSQNGQSVLINTLSAGTTSTTINNLTAATPYAFNLVAVNGNATAATPWIVVTTNGGLIAPTTFTATALSQSSVSLSWSTAPAATGYRLYQSENGQAVAIATYAAGTNTATVNGLNAGTTYSFNLVAYNGGASAATPWISVTTMSSITPPGNFVATPASGSQINLSWTAATGATGYNLFQFVNGAPTLIATYDISTTSATISGLAANTTYAFNLVATNTNTGASAASSWINATTLGPVSPPTNFTGAGLSATQVGLTWTAATGALGYYLYEFKSGSPVLVASYSAGTTSATVSGLTASTAYSFNLVAFNGTATAASPWISVSTTA